MNKLTRMLIATAAMALVLSTSANAMYCSVPSAPFDSSNTFNMNMYYNQLEDYQRCVQNNLEAQNRARQRQQQQQQQNQMWGGSLQLGGGLFGNGL